MVRCIVLDIEGTTCPVSFVASVLFPYAREHLGPFLEANQGDPEVADLIKDVEAAWQADPHREAQQLRQAALNQPIPVASIQAEANTADALPAAPPAATIVPPTNASTVASTVLPAKVPTKVPTVAPSVAPTVVPYLHWLIDHDIKLTALKDLQGRVWTAGYACGDLVAPLFHHVAPTLKRWHQQGYQLAVYSSGSVAAQQLLYRHSQNGNLEGLFSHWFDTRIGPKQAPASYNAIAAALQLEPAEILFVSDAIAEIEAAHGIGMEVRFSDRPGNPARDPGDFSPITSLAEIHLPAVA
jgi:enolase-phosphatase E1